MTTKTGRPSAQPARPGRAGTGATHTSTPRAAGRPGTGRGAVARAAAARRRRRGYLLWGVAFVVVAAVIAALMYSAQSTSTTETRTAPDFTLTDSSGQSVHLADYRGRTVVLYFSEGAGCQSCLYQMADIEAHASDFSSAGVTVLPIVMNTADQIRRDMAANHVKTPFLIDSDGSVSAAYGTLGKGMHAGLPGHSFVLIDAGGVQRWYGEYPSMYLSSADLLKQVRQHLS
jgi:peroxiredoxin